jgi:hypothetical protein
MGTVPYRISETEHRAGAIQISAEGLACTKAICNYIHDTYGRFPGGTDAMHLMWVMQAHHIDTDYYDRFFGPGAYGPAHAAGALAADWISDFSKNPYGLWLLQPARAMDIYALDAGI